MKRKIIKIDEEKCDGCGLCVPECHEGALQIIDGKARLVSDLMCDGLGACIGHCPQGAISIEEREAEPYDEIAVMQEMVTKGKNTVIAHLNHLKDHHEFGYLKQGARYLKEHREEVDFDVDEVIATVHQGNGRKHQHAHAAAHVEEGGCGGGCPGSAEVDLEEHKTQENLSKEPTGTIPSQLAHWPVQMHLINPTSEQFRNADLLLSADCVAYAMGDFHRQYLKGKSLAIACPKLDSNKESYVEKLMALIDEAKINTITVMKMVVPCCGGLLQLAQIAAENASRKVPIKSITVGLQGEIQDEQWI